MIPCSERQCKNCEFYPHNCEYKEYNVCSKHTAHVSPYGYCNEWKEYKEEKK